MRLEKYNFLMVAVAIGLILCFASVLVATDLPDVMRYVIVVTGVLVFSLFYYHIVLRIREQHMTQIIARHNRRLALILHTTKVRVWLFDVKTRTLSWMSSNGEIDQRQHSLEEYAYIYRKETFDKLEETIDAMLSGQQEKCVVELVSRDGYGDRDNFVRLSVFRRTKKGVPSVIVGMMDDQTTRLHALRQAKDNMLRYQSIFSNSMVDIIYYDTEGRMADINQTACRTFHCNRQELLNERLSFNKALEDPDMTPERFDGCHSTHIMKARENPYLAKSIKFKQDMYYEQQLLPVYDSSNHLLGLFGSGRDVTEFVNSYHQLKRSVKRMMLAAQDVTEYINSINYAMHVGGVRMVNYSPDTHILTIYREMNVVQLTLTQSRCLSLLDEESRRGVIRLMNNMDMKTAETIDITIKTCIRRSQYQRLSLQLHLNPVYDEKGVIDGYFGMCRDVSQEYATAEKLEQEKAKAQEVENVKNAFLRNMSYEIRTPITTVVGFAELFAEEHDPDDEDKFIDEIKSNSSYLLKLVNDILFLSRLDAHMIEFKKSPTDFALMFEGHCQLGWEGEKKPDVKYEVINPYEHLVVELDDSNVGHIIEEVAENAAHYTASGFVRARYDYIGDRLLITVEDTGKGISSDQQNRLFERFSSDSGRNGAGLGLPICKELAHQMGGAVHVNSAPGKGTTFWIEMPCKAILVEKRGMI